MRVSHSRRGFTLTEIAIVLGIVGIILGGIWTAAASVYRAKKINQEVEEIQAIVQGVRSLYATRGQFAAGATCIQTLLINAGVFPSDMVGAPGVAGICSATVHNPWGESVDVGTQMAWFGLPPSPNDFEILVGWPADSVSPAECVSVLGAIVGSPSASNGLVGVGYFGFETQNIAGITDPSFFQGCSGDFGLQYSLK